MTNKLLKENETLNKEEMDIFLEEWPKEQLLPDSEVVLSALTALNVLGFEVTDHGELKHLNFAQVVHLFMQMEAQKEATSKIFRTAHFEERLNPRYSLIKEQAEQLVKGLSYGTLLSDRALKTSLKLIHNAMKEEPDALADFWSESSNAVIYPISQVKALSNSQISVPYVGVVDLRKMLELPRLMKTITTADYVGFQRVGDSQTFHLITVKKKQKEVGQSIIDRIVGSARIWSDPSDRPPLVVVGVDFQVKGGAVVKAYQMPLVSEYIEDAKFSDMKLLFSADTVEEAFEQMKKLHKEEWRSFFVIKEDLDIEKMIEDETPEWNETQEIKEEKFRQAWERYTKFLNQCQDELLSVILTIDESMPSSQQCSNCFSRGELYEDGYRIYKCKRCTARFDRDVNAAINIAKKGFEMIQKRIRWFHNAEKGIDNPNRCSIDPKEVHVGYLAPHIPRLVDIQMKHPNGENGEVSLLPIKSVKQRNEYDTIDLHFTAEEDISERDKETEPLDLRFTPEKDLPKRGENPETVKISPLKHTRLIVPPGVPEPEWLKDDTTA